MTDLIPVNYDADIPTVSGRELCNFLEVNSNYATWFKRMCEYGFVENIDFVTCFPNSESGLHGGQNKIDHAMTIPMAKEISMIQRNEKGKHARQYLIKVEDAWNSPEMIMARALKLSDNKIKSLETDRAALTAQIDADRPKVAFAEAVAASRTSILVGELAKLLRQNGIEMGQNRLFKWLRKNGFLLMF